MLVSDIFMMIVLLTGILIALYTDLSDLKGGFIPDKLTYTLIFFGVIFHLFLSLFFGTLDPVLFSVSGAVLGFLLGFVLYFVGLVGGGDLKLLIAIGALMPNSPTPIVDGLVPLSSYPFSVVVVLLNGILLEAPFVLVFVVYCLVSGKSIFSREVLISDLEGLEIPDEAVYKKNGVVSVGDDLPDDVDEVFADPSDLGGLCEDDIVKLEELRDCGDIGSSIRVKRSYPFVPVIAAGVFSMVLFGNLYWNFLMLFL